MLTAADTFRLARKHATHHMAACEQANLRWSETSITEVVTAHAARAVTVVTFTQKAEALSGADWVWWWIDGASAYGMLVQAKRVTVTEGSWTFKFGYITRGRSQREVLQSVAGELGLLPVYALYLGTGNYRRWSPCSGNHQGQRCISCVKRTVSLMPALLADDLLVTDAASTYERSVALEDTWTPTPAGAPLIPAIKEQLSPELLDYLRGPQNGTRAVSRSMIDLVLRARVGQHRTGLPTTAEIHPGYHDELGAVFPEVPQDTGHWNQPYFEHALHPLRHVPPGYVLDIIEGNFDESSIIATGIRANVAGIVVVQVPQVE